MASKLKDDQRDAKADIAVIVSEALPAGLTHFRLIEGVWVASITSAQSLALALRVVLIQSAREKKLQAGKKKKWNWYITILQVRSSEIE